MEFGFTHLARINRTLFFETSIFEPLKGGFGAKNTASRSAVRQLRDFSRLGETGEKHQPVNLNSVIEQAFSFTKPKWETQSFAAGSQVRVKIDFRDLPDILGDAARLRDAVTNLIFNALDAMPQGDTLTLRTRAEGDAVLLQVSDIPA
jgi:signal transduction histidine kinase